MKLTLILLTSLAAALEAADVSAQTVEAPPVKSQFSATQFSGTGVDSELNEIKQFIENRDYRRAVQMLKQIAKSRKNNPEVWRLLGVASLKKGDFLGAKVAFEKSLEIDSENRETLGAQAELFISIGDRDSARANLYKLDAICPNGCDERDRLASSLDLY